MKKLKIDELVQAGDRMRVVSEKISKVLAESDLTLDEGLTVITEQVLSSIRYVAKTEGRCSLCLLTRMVQILQLAPDFAKHLSELEAEETTKGGPKGPTVH